MINDSTDIAAALAPKVALITDGQNPRVWSLLVTVFGDLALAPDASISGKILGNIMSGIGIKPEATRVALHRLRKDNWIESSRIGRTSSYRLTPSGRSQSQAALPLIYGTTNAAKDCRLIISQPGKVFILPDRRTVKISADVALSSDRDVIRTNMALPLPTLLPDWLPDHVCDAALFQSAAQTHRRMVALRTALDRTPAATPMERAVLRVLVVHAWRRIALRAPILPDNVFPVGWAGADCRSLNAALLTMLARPTLAQLDDHQIESIPCNIT